MTFGGTNSWNLRKGEEKMVPPKVICSLSDFSWDLFQEKTLVPPKVNFGPTKSCHHKSNAINQINADT